jgi:hypothetical protein
MFIPNSSRAKQYTSSKEENHDNFKNCSYVSHATKLDFAGKPKHV